MLVEGAEVALIKVLQAVLVVMAAAELVVEVMLMELPAQLILAVVEVVLVTLVEILVALEVQAL